MNFTRYTRHAVIKWKRFWKASKIKNKNHNNNSDGDSGEGVARNNKEIAVIIRDSIGILVAGILASIFFGTEHKVLGLWASFVGLVSAFHIPFHQWSRDEFNRCKAWLCYSSLSVFIFFGFLFWSYRILHPPHDQKFDFQIIFASDKNVIPISAGSTLKINDSRMIVLSVANSGKSGSRFSIRISTPINPEYVSFPMAKWGLSAEYVSNADWSIWDSAESDWMQTSSIFLFSPLVISSNFEARSFPAYISVVSDNSRFQKFFVNFVLPAHTDFAPKIEK